MQQHEAGFSPREALTILFRRRLTILLVVLLSLATAAAYLGVAHKQYAAMTHVLVGLGREKFEDLGMQTQPVGNLVFQERAQNINNEVEILKDPALMEQALPAIKARLAREPKPAAGALQRAATWLADLPHRLGLWRPTDPDTALAIKLYKELSVSAVKETDVIDVGFTWTDPVFAADALNIFLAAYQTQHLRVYETKRSVAFFQQELQKAQAELAAVEADEAAFLKKGGLSNFEVEKSQLLSELAALRTEAAAARLDSSVAQARAASPGDGQDSAVLDQNILQLQTERSRLLTRFDPEASQVQNIDQQIARLSRQKVQGISAHYHSRATAQAERVAGLALQIAAKEQALREVSAGNAEYDAIHRRHVAATGLVEEYRRKLEDLQEGSALNAGAFSSVRVLSEATPPMLPSAPKPALLLGLALGFGLLAGIAYAMLAEFLDHTFRQPRQVASILGVQVLALVPDLPAPKGARS